MSTGQPAILSAGTEGIKFGSSRMASLHEKNRKDFYKQLHEQQASMIGSRGPDNAPQFSTGRNYLQRTTTPRRGGSASPSRSALPPVGAATNPTATPSKSPRPATAASSATTPKPPNSATRGRPATAGSPSSREMLQAGVLAPVPHDPLQETIRSWDRPIVATPWTVKKVRIQSGEEEEAAAADAAAVPLDAVDNKSPPQQRQQVAESGIRSDGVTADAALLPTLEAEELERCLRRACELMALASTTSDYGRDGLKKGLGGYTRNLVKELSTYDVYV